MFIGQLALIASAAFTGAAIFVHLAEQPARLALDDRALLLEWQRSYPGAAKLQASLALIGGLLAILAYILAPDWRWLIAAFLMLANLPYTLLIVRPVNAALHAMSPDAAGPQPRRMIEQWGRLHAVRTGLGAAATIVLFLALN